MGQGEAEGSVMMACLSLGRAIAVEGELKEHAEVSQWQSAKFFFHWQDVSGCWCQCWFLPLQV